MPLTPFHSGDGSAMQRENAHQKHRQKRPRKNRRLLRHPNPHQRKKPPLLLKQPANNRPKRPTNRQSCRLSKRLGHGPKNGKRNSSPILARCKRKLQPANRIAKPLSDEDRTK